MDARIESRKDAGQRTLVELGIALHRDWGVAYARYFLESVGANESVIKRVIAEGAVCP